MVLRLCGEHKDDGDGAAGTGRMAVPASTLAFAT
jgi:hypothetical protein